MPQRLVRKYNNIQNPRFKMLTAAVVISVFLVFGLLIFRVLQARQAESQVIRTAKIVCERDNVQNGIFIQSIRDSVEQAASYQIKGFGPNERERNRRNANNLLKKIAPLDCELLPDQVVKKPPPKPITMEEANSTGHGLPPEGSAADQGS